VQPIGGLQQPYQLIRKSPTPDLPFLTANTIKGNICPDVLQFFSFPQTEDIERKAIKKKVHLFLNRKTASPISVATFHIS
jgi:hypothetical protein